MQTNDVFLWFLFTHYLTSHPPFPVYTPLACSHRRKSENPHKRDIHSWPQWIRKCWKCLHWKIPLNDILTQIGDFTQGGLTPIYPHFDTILRDSWGLILGGIFQGYLPNFTDQKKQYQTKYISDGIWHLFFDTHASHQTLAAFKTTDRLHLDSCTDRWRSHKRVQWSSSPEFHQHPGRWLMGWCFFFQPNPQWVGRRHPTTHYSTVAPQSFIMREVILVEQIDMEMPKGLRHTIWTRLSWSSKQR